MQGTKTSHTGKCKNNEAIRGHNFQYGLDKKMTTGQSETV